ncbi:MAG: AAA family ATPase [Fusobacteria bacterium]|nr:AAA family ATPase [Fusobacteriota bacterium]
MAIILVGFTGVGKSTIGREIAQELKFKFIDLDNEIECRERELIKSIFSNHGEDYFRSVEIRILKEIIGENLGSISVISTGGGTIESSEAREVIKNGNVVVYLRCDKTLIEKRRSVLKDRPILERCDWEVRFEEREKWYESVSTITYFVSDILEENAQNITAELTKIIKKTIK